MFKRRQRCIPQRQRNPNTLLASCSLFGHSLAARIASLISAKVSSRFFNVFAYDKRPNWGVDAVARLITSLPLPLAIRSRGSRPTICYVARDLNARLPDEPTPQIYIANFEG